MSVKENKLIKELLKRYITLNVRGLTFQMKMENEGVVLDILNEDDEVIETTYKFFNEFGIENVKWYK